MNEKQGLLLLGASPALAVGLGLGAVAGYFLSKKRLETKYNHIAEQEIAEAKRFYSVLNKKDEFETPESAVETLGIVTDATDALLSYQGIPKVLSKEETESLVEDFVPNPPEEIKEIEVQSVSIDAEPAPHHGPIKIVKKNIFTESISDDHAFNYEEELKHRTETEPYVISHEEFLEAQTEYTQTSLTYYEGDDVLVDERDQPIPDVDETVGVENMSLFGHGSGDKNVVFIRNDRIDLDFEVVRSPGKYAEEVLGYFEHSDHRSKIRRFRGDDE